MPGGLDGTAMPAAHGTVVVPWPATLPMEVWKSEEAGWNRNPGSPGDGIGKQLLSMAEIKGTEPAEAPSRRQEMAWDDDGSLLMDRRLSHWRHLQSGIAPPCHWVNRSISHEVDSKSDSKCSMSGILQKARLEWRYRLWTSFCGGSPKDYMLLAEGWLCMREHIPACQFMEQTWPCKGDEKSWWEKRYTTHLVRPQIPRFWENVPEPQSADGEGLPGHWGDRPHWQCSACDVPWPESRRWESAGAVFWEMNSPAHWHFHGRSIGSRKSRLKSSSCCRFWRHICTQHAILSRPVWECAQSELEAGRSCPSSKMLMIQAGACLTRTSKVAAFLRKLSHGPPHSSEGRHGYLQMEELQ